MSSFPTRVHLKQWQGFHLNLNSVHPGFRQCEHVWRITALGLLRGLRVWRIVAWPPRRVHLMGFPGGASGKEPVCQCRRWKSRGFHPWVGEMPWRRAWQPTPVFLHGESHGQRSLVGYSPWGCKESDMAEVTFHAGTPMLKAR